MQHPSRLIDVAGGDRGNWSTSVASSHVKITLQITAQQPLWSQSD